MASAQVQVQEQLLVVGVCFLTSNNGLKFLKKSNKNSCILKYSDKMLEVFVINIPSRKKSVFEK